MTRILVIEDDTDMSAEITACLSASGFSPERCFDGLEGLNLALKEDFDAITLDRMLPGCDGLEVAKALREAGRDVPILMLSALSDLDDRLAGLRGGGDDYLIKPFEPSELVVRLQVLLRRTARTKTRDGRLKVGDLQMDLLAREVHRGKRRVDLLAMEFKLLEFMMRNAGQMLSRRMIFEHVWEYDFDPGTNLIDVHVGRLRRKIDEPGQPSCIAPSVAQDTSSMQFDELRRSTTFRLTALYGLLFALGTIAMLGMIYLRSAGYLTNRVDTILNTEADALLRLPQSGLRDRIAEELAMNGTRISIYAQFAPDGSAIAGNLATLPSRLRAGEAPVEIPPSTDFPASARLIARRLPNGDILVVGRDVSQLREMRSIISSALFWSGITILIAGLVLGIALSVAPLRRLKLLQDVASDIAGGDLKRRLPVTARRDELDVLAGAVNYMIGEVERLMSEVKGSTEIIAHDLVSPLAHAAQQLRRIQRSDRPDAADIDLVSARIEDVLERFRAILRISELDSHQRRAGFSIIDLADVLSPISDLYQPLAEAGRTRLIIQAERGITIEGDAKLLFEALANLVDNAIKFAGPNSTVRIFLNRAAQGAQIVVEDDGPGIPASERQAVLQRFYRSERGRLVSGSGLGLSVVAAIVRLHRFSLHLEDADPGVRAVINCWPSPDPASVRH